MHKKNDLLFLVLCPASDLQNTDWFYKSPFSKIDSFKFQVSTGIDKCGRRIIGNTVIFFCYPGTLRQNHLNWTTRLCL